MIVGIDPGARGALAFLSDDGHLVDVLDMPAVEVKTGGKLRTRIAPQAVALLIDARRPVHAYVERVGAMPGQGVSSSFTFGYAAGVLEGVLSALGIAVSFIAPAVWKRALKLPADKGNARQMAMQLWPARSADFTRVRDDGRAEAALIAHWGMLSRLVGKEAA